MSYNTSNSFAAERFSTTTSDAFGPKTATRAPAANHRCCAADAPPPTCRRTAAAAQQLPPLSDAIACVCVAVAAPLTLSSCFVRHSCAPDRQPVRPPRPARSRSPSPPLPPHRAPLVCDRQGGAHEDQLEDGRQPVKAYHGQPDRLRNHCIRSGLHPWRGCEGGRHQVRLGVCGACLSLLLHCLSLLLRCLSLLLHCLSLLLHCLSLLLHCLSLLLHCLSLLLRFLALLLRCPSLLLRCPSLLLCCPSLLLRCLSLLLHCLSLPVCRLAILSAVSVLQEGADQNKLGLGRHQHQHLQHDTDRRVCIVRGGFTDSHRQPHP